MKVYDVVTPYNAGQTHSVVAKSMADAERITKEKYGPIEIKKITVHADYVLVQGIDDNKKE